eukprot:12769-Heterococcus_DN1.PRE.4
MRMPSGSKTFDLSAMQHMTTHTSLVGLGIGAVYYCSLASAATPVYTAESVNATAQNKAHGPVHHDDQHDTGVAAALRHQPYVMLSSLTRSGRASRQYNTAAAGSRCWGNTRPC